MKILALILCVCTVQVSAGGFNSKNRPTGGVRKEHCKLKYSYFIIFIKIKIFCYNFMKISAGNTSKNCGYGRLKETKIEKSKSMLNLISNYLFKSHYFPENCVFNFPIEKNRLPVFVRPSDCSKSCKLHFHVPGNYQFREDFFFPCVCKCEGVDYNEISRTDRERISEAIDRMKWPFLKRIDDLER